MIPIYSGSKCPCNWAVLRQGHHRIPIRTVQQLNCSWQHSHCTSTTQLLLATMPLPDHTTIKQIVFSTYQSVSGTVPPRTEWMIGSTKTCELSTQSASQGDIFMDDGLVETKKMSLSVNIQFENEHNRRHLYDVVVVGCFANPLTISQIELLCLLYLHSYHFIFLT